MLLRARAATVPGCSARRSSRTPPRARYAARNGIEGAISQAVHTLGLRQCRCHGLAKTRLQHQRTATALNLTRIDARTRGDPPARTRASHLERLRPAEITLDGTNEPTASLQARGPRRRRDV
ncbi:transposase [Streptomyces hydrogenans]